jgi:hypothetical protein|tara:strand:- start:426 stop:1133 length:708 start_codon:yes stop_codon:yes gene_type:complete
MFIILVGCEYSGTSTISKSLKSEFKEILGSEFDIHDHWKFPNIECYPQYSKQYTLNKTDKSHISQFTPKLKEMLQRQSLVYHLPAPKVSIDKIYAGYHFDDTVYAPIYFDYGGPKEPQGGPRTKYARYIEKEIIKSYPDTILIHLTASKESILERMQNGPHENQIIAQDDIDLITEQFQLEFDKSLLQNKFTIDNTGQSIKQTTSDAMDGILNYCTPEDLARIRINKLINERNNN